jgi:hypothetical protein
MISAAAGIPSAANKIVVVIYSFADPVCVPAPRAGASLS